MVKTRNRPPKTRHELDQYLRIYFGIYLSSKSIEEGNSCPLEFVWDVYSTALGISDNKCFNFLGLAARGAQKTLSVATIETLLIQHDDRNLIHMASIYNQAHVCYDHFKKIIGKPYMKGVASDPTMKETVSLKNGNKIKITTATLDAVNSFHGSLFRDELDLTPKKIFDESQGMLSAEKGKSPINVCISSRKFAIGNVQRLLDKLKKEPGLYRKHQWGVLEFTQKCFPDRHGKYGTEIYVDEDNLIAISKEEYESIAENSSHKLKYVQTVGYENCVGCGIFSFCKGRLPNQSDDNPYLQPIEDTKRQFKDCDSEMFKAQFLNRKPSREGLIYPMWDEEIHVKSYGQMWEIFHGSPHPDLVKDPATNRAKRYDIEFNELCQAFISAGCRFYIGIDFGFSIRAVAGLYVVDGSGRVYFIDEISRKGFSDTELGQELKKLWGHLPIECVYADPESPGGKKEIRKETNWYVTEKVDKDIEAGFNTVRKFLRVPGTKRTNFYCAVACVVFREEIQYYHYKIDIKSEKSTEVVEKKEDHSCDQNRYFLHSLFGKSMMNLGSESDYKTPNDTFDPQKPTRAPTAVELAQITGNMAFKDNRDEYEYDPETNTHKKKDDKEPSGSGGGGGLFWDVF